MVRVVALVTALAVAGLSSALAVCVAGCTDPQPEATHACHEDSPASSIGSGTGACSHEVPSLDRVDLARDSDTPTLAGDGASMNLPRPAVRMASLGVYSAANSLARPPARSPILRI